MSNWLEQTIVICKEDEQTFLSQCKENEFEVSNPVKVYDGKSQSDHNIVIYNYDSNGDGPWYQGRAHLPRHYLFLEICYGSMGLITERYNPKINGVEETRYHLKNLLKKVIPAEHYADVINKICYTI